jgi:hypothetical protein
LLLSGVESDRQVITRRDEPVPALGLEKRREAGCVIRALKLNHRNVPVRRALIRSTALLTHEIMLSDPQHTP